MNQARRCCTRQEHMIGGYFRLTSHLTIIQVFTDQFFSCTAGVPERFHSLVGRGPHTDENTYFYGTRNQCEAVLHY